VSNDDLRERFFRERRLLLGISVVLLAHQLLGITIDKSAETLGLRFQIDDPAKIWWAVWAVWLWTAICAVQQLNSITIRSEYPKDRTEEIRGRLSDWIAVRRVRKDAMKHLRQSLPRALKPKFTTAFVEHKKADKPQGQLVLYACVTVIAQWQCDDANGAAEKAATLDEAMKAAGWEIAGGSVGHEGGKCNFSRTVNVRVVPIREERMVRLASVTWTVVSTSFVTDYIAPLIIAVAPVMIAIGQAIARSHSRIWPW
jgi:hypothetical protein